MCLTWKSPHATSEPNYRFGPRSCFACRNLWNPLHLATASVLADCTKLLGVLDQRRQELRAAIMYSSEAAAEYMRPAYLGMSPVVTFECPAHAEMCSE